MKTLLVSLFILFFNLSSAQDVWVNSYTTRDGKYIPGHYRTPPNSTNRDNYSTLGNTNPYTGKDGTVPRDANYLYSPQSSVNLPLVAHVLSTKQSQYDYNSNKIKTYIIKCRESLDSSGMDATLIQNIKDSFNTNYLTPYYNKGYDLSSDSTTNQIIEWMQSGLLSTIKTEGDKFNAKTKREDNEVLEFMKYHGGYEVPLLNEYVLENGKYKLIKSERANNYFYYDGDMIYFKRGISSGWLHRKLTFKMFNSYLNTYSYDSEYGSVFIDKDFKILTLVDDSKNNTGAIKKYEYIIGNYDQAIKPKN